MPNLYLSSGTIKDLYSTEHKSLITKKKIVFKLITLVNYQGNVIRVIGTGLLVSINAVLINGHYDN